MPLKGYTNVTDVAMQLGRTLTAEQQTHCTNVVLPAVEEWIDITGGRAYNVGPVTHEVQQMASAYTWVKNAPIASVDAVRGYYYGQVPDNMIDVPWYRWRLIDADIGQIYMPWWYLYAYIEIDYTPLTAIPGRVKLAAAVLAGVFMRSVVHPQSEWLTEYASATDVRIKMRDLEIPDRVYELLGGSPGGIVIA